MTDLLYFTPKTDMHCQKQEQWITLMRQELITPEEYVGMGGTWTREAIEVAVELCRNRRFPIKTFRRLIMGDDDADKTMARI